MALKKTILSSLFFISLFVFFSQATPALAVDWSNKTTYGAAQIKDLEVIIAKLLNIFFSLVGIALIAMLATGGFQYLTSGDNPKTAEQAKKTLTYAFLGLASVILSWAILNFLGEFTGLGSNLTKFQIGI